jgi:two-component system, NarL family, sensor histidine kinase DegS
MSNSCNDNFINGSNINSFNYLNDFLINLINESLEEKEELVLIYKKNNKALEKNGAKIILLKNNICYDDNIFNPNNSNYEIDNKIIELTEKNEKLLMENKKLENKITYILKRIDDTNSIINKIANNSKKDSLNNKSQESEIYKIEILRSQELERKRIARDLHDTVIQNLTNLIHKAEFTLKIMDIDNIRAKLELVTISNSVKNIINEMRNIIYNLRPMAFDDIGIDVIIERELSDIKAKGIIVKYDIIGESGKIDQIVLITLLRIVQEACNNAVKHANATRIDVKIIYDENCIEIYIIDNGKGFKIPDSLNIIYKSKSGFGLSMMKERVYLLSGIIDFKSNDEGTQIYVKVPKCFREGIENADKYSNS